MMALPFRALALLQLAVILGIAAGLGFSQWQSQPPTESSSDASQVVGEVELPAQVPSPPVEPSLNDGPPSDSKPRTLAEWLEGEPVPVSSGNGQIGGIVLLDGEPLQGLELTATVVIPADGDEDDDLLDQVLTGVKSMRLRNSLERTSTSDEGGNFSFEGLDEEYSYHIGAPDHFLSSADPQMSAPYPTGSELEFNARARQKSNSNAGKKQRPWATGGFDRTVLVGTIQNMLRGSLYIFEGHGAPPEHIDQAQRLNLNRVTFRKALVPGPYTLVAVTEPRGGEEKIINSWPLEVKPGFNLVHLFIDLPPVMEVVVSSASGEPIENARFDWRRVSEGGGGSSLTRPIKTEGNRYFLLPNYQTLKVFAGGSEEQAFLKVSVPGQTAVEIPIDRIETIEVTFDPVSYLDVDVIGYLGSGLEGILSFHLANQDGGPSAGATIDWLGTLRLGPVTPGRYELQTSAKIGGSRSGYHRIAQDPVHLAPGENTIAITLPPMYELTLDFDDELLGKRGSLTHTQSSIPRQFTASRGLHLTSLIAGEYQLQIGQISKLVRIPQQDSVFIAYEIEINTMVISQILAGSPAEVCGLQVGDQVIAFNGVTFSGREELNAAAPTATDSEVTLTLIRNGIEMQLTVSPTDMQGILPELIRR
ncbi:MAG TPA: PDZ domain-containing protein [Planctomycetes bacterium]|nr:PDZ domain-containing protein [Planctomycetota bacterium]